jgi:hypothetical protein
MDTELDNQVNNQEEQEQQVEQVNNDTPQDEKEPEFYLDDNGDLQWNTDEFDSKDDEDSESNAQEEEQPTETEEDTHEEETDEEPKYTVKVDGEEIEVTQDELLRGYMRQKDYTQKTQQLAEQRRQFEQYRPQYQPQPQQQTQEPQQQDLNDIAKQVAARQLGLDSPEDLSELDFNHITAVVEAKQALINQRNAMMYRQHNIDNLEAQLRSEEPKYDEIMANINNAMQNLPVSKFNTLKQAYAEGNPEPLREFFKEMQKEYYSKAIKKVEQKKNTPVPKVESSANTPIVQTKKQNKIDFKQFGHMTTEQKAKILLERGFLD